MSFPGVCREKKRERLGRQWHLNLPHFHMIFYTAEIGEKITSIVLSPIIPIVTDFI